MAYAFRGGAVRAPLQQRQPQQQYQPAPAPVAAPKPPAPAPVHNDMGSRGHPGGRIPGVATQVQRAPHFGVDYSSQDQVPASPTTFGTDYNRTNVNTDRQTPPREPDYLYAPVGEIKKKFGGPKNDQVQVQRTGRRWQPPDPSATGGDRPLIYGWSTKVQPDSSYQPGPGHEKYLYSGSTNPPRPQTQAPAQPAQAPSQPAHAPPQPLARQARQQPPQAQYQSQQAQYQPQQAHYQSQQAQYQPPQTDDYSYQQSAPNVVRMNLTLAK